ncbi:MAG TPA: hypothetical protein VHM90_00315 [Phycisphaerae bacterium]|nr:hypothetical protein [Phycisphaerae bacterium]
MVWRCFLLSVAVAAGSSLAGFGQTKPADSAIGGAVSREVKGLTSEDFPERQAALARLKTLVAGQLKQRAEIQEVLSALQADLAKQQQALAMVSADEEAMAQISGLLEMERGLAGWTIQTMAEPLEKRTALLNWGLTKERADILARCYGQSKRTRIQAIKDLAKMEDEGASWTLAKLINDPETPVRAQAMASAWSRKPTVPVVDALWYRAVAGPLTVAGREGRMMRAMEDSGNIKIDFPGTSDPMEFGEDDESAGFFDSQLAGAVLVHLNSDLVAEKMKALLAERVKQNKTLALMEDPDWTLVTHWLVETYKIKEAVPVLAMEAFSDNTEQMGGDMNGREFMWTGRTMAIGTLCTLIGKEPGDFGLFKARNMGETKDWMWAVDANLNAGGGGQPDAAAVRGFYTFWQQHHAEYGVKEEPPPSPIRNVRGGRGRIPLEGGPAVDVPARPMPIGPPPAPGGVAPEGPANEPLPARGGAAG